MIGLWERSTASRTIKQWMGNPDAAASAWEGDEAWAEAAAMWERAGAFGRAADLFGRERTVPYIRDRDASTIPRRLADGVPPRPADFDTFGAMDGATPASELPLGPEGPPDGWPRREGYLLAILDETLARYRVDPDRVYLTGLSYGGFGTWYLASRHPQRFAAIAPIIGGLAEPLAPKPSSGPARRGCRRRRSSACCSWR